MQFTRWRQTLFLFFVIAVHIIILHSNETVLQSAECVSFVEWLACLLLKWEVVRLPGSTGMFFIVPLRGKGCIEVCEGL